MNRGMMLELRQLMLEVQSAKTIPEMNSVKDKVSEFRTKYPDEMVGVSLRKRIDRKLFKAN